MEMAKQNKPDEQASVIDPVCGMTVETDKAAAHAEHEGVRFYFCSKRCHDRFVAEPSRYLNAADTAPQAPASEHATVYFTCPMHPEIRQMEPGACPKCGMTLEPVGVPAPATKIEYTCPMHPEIVQDHPGNCPKCGMTLEPRGAVAEEEGSAELRDMTRRFWVSTLLAVPVFISATSAEFWPEAVAEIMQPRMRQWIEMILATPVVVWGGWMFYVRAVRSVVTRNLNMFTA